jgi:hypothetical protein
MSSVTPDGTNFRNVSCSSLNFTSALIATSKYAYKYTRIIIINEEGRKHTDTKTNYAPGKSQEKRSKAYNLVHRREDEEGGRRKQREIEAKNAIL